MFKDMKFCFKSLGYQNISLAELMTLVKLGGGTRIDLKRLYG